MIDVRGQFRTRAYLWVLASIPFVFMVAWFWNRGPGLGANDYALTLMHAQALVDGRPYADNGMIWTPLDQQAPVQPPGFPLLLAAAIKVAGGFDWTLVKLVAAASALPFVLLAGLYFSRVAGLAVGVTTTVMLTVAVAASAPNGATHVQTDLGFAGLIWATLFLLDHGKAVSWPRTLGVFTLGTAAMSYRFLGVAVVPAIALYAVANRARGGHKLVVPLAIWSAGAAAVLATAGWSPIGRQVSLNPQRFFNLDFFRYFAVPAVQAHLYPLPWNVFNDVFHGLSLSAAVVGIVAWSRTGWRSGAWLFMVCYLVTLAQVYARDGRYLIPLYPILIYGLLNGMTIALSWFKPDRSPTWSATVAARTGLAVAAAALVIMLIQVPRKGGYLTELPEVQALFSHLMAEQTVPEPRVAFTQAHVLTWATGIPSMVVPAAPPQMTMAEIDRLSITHVVLDRMQLAPERTDRMSLTRDANRCRFELTFDNGSFEVYRVMPPCLSGSP